MKNIITFICILVLTISSLNAEEFYYKCPSDKSSVPYLYEQNYIIETGFNKNKKSIKIRVLSTTINKRWTIYKNNQENADFKTLNFKTSKIYQHGEYIAAPEKYRFTKNNDNTIKVIRLIDDGTMYGKFVSECNRVDDLLNLY